MIRRAGEQALRWGLLPSNPAALATPPSTPTDEVDAPDDTVILALLDAADEADPELYAVTYLDISTGLRRGELCGLQWGDTHEDSGTVVIRRGVVEIASTLHVKDTKTHSERVVSLDPATAGVLRRHRA